MIQVQRDRDGQWPDWAYEAAGIRLQLVGGTDQWQHASYRMAYLRIVLDALEAGMPQPA